MSILFDADASRTSRLANQHRGATTVGDLHDDYRARMVTAYVTARDEWRRLELQAEALVFNLTHPGEPSLAAEMRATVAGDPAGVA